MNNPIEISPQEIVRSLWFKACHNGDYASADKLWEKYQELLNEPSEKIEEK